MNLIEIIKDLEKAKELDKECWRRSKTKEHEYYFEGKIKAWDHALKLLNSIKKVDYRIICNPEYGYYIGTKTNLDCRTHNGICHVFAWHLRPCLYKSDVEAENALTAIPEKAKKKARIIPCFVDLPFTKLIQECRLFEEEA